MQCFLDFRHVFTSFHFVSVFFIVFYFSHPHRVADALRREEVEHDVISFNACISACEKGLQWQHAFGLLQQITREQLSPTQISCSAEQRTALLLCILYLK